MHIAGKLPALPEVAVRVTFAAVGLRNFHRNGQSHRANMKVVEDFKSRSVLENQNLAITLARMSRQRTHFIKFGHFDEIPENTWSKFKKGDMETSVPMILGRHRT